MRILIIQFKRIGDLILTSSLLTVLHRYFPGVSIDLAVEKGSAGILPAFPPHTARIFTRGALNLSELAVITRSDYDVCLDLNGSDRSLLLTALSRAKRRITYQKVAKKFLRPRAYTDWVDSPLRKRHTVDHFLDILRPLGVSEEGESPVLNIPESEETRAGEALQSAGITGPCVVIHPGTARAEKLWPPERWAAVAKWFQGNHALPVVITGVESDRAFAGIDRILRDSGNACVSLVGKLSLLGTAAVIQRAKMLCSVDSAPIHIAEALRTPVVALFGPMNPYVWMPRHTANRMVHPFIAPDAFSPETPAAKMEEISPESVIRNITEII
ncbi:MAG: glycosyltransferase family 9 protein [Chthoniobacterales bacterium]